ncbi:hypothetical protein FE257_003814 [Aspergillus nanangensis]|uniref:F-box domain-containing protein n=1 Tax=Aspergillus nanangensis TaxID=2582783 RepID=A0AAD4GPE7_ASPNN|nr:hypothetical protein FE257_003814 [Aspergillus nanangensis]
MSSADSTASSRVLATPEILEMILLELDLRTLLTAAQRVSHTWVRIIKGSPSLQKALFYQSTQTKTTTPDAIFYNPLLMDAFPSVFPPSMLPPRGSASTFSFGRLKMFRTPEKMDPFLRQEASWRRMLVQQPPAQSVVIFQRVHAQTSDYHRQYALEGKNTDPHEGITMEMLFEALLFHPKIGCGIGSRTYFLWNHCCPVSRPSRGDRDINDAFQKTLTTTDIVIYVRAVMQCSQGGSPIVEEQRWHQIRGAYRRSRSN